MRYLRTLVFSCLSTACVYSHGQPATPTVNALQRTFMIQTIHGRGTVFSIDIDNRENWITAKHLFTGIETGPQGEFLTKSVQANILAPVGNGDKGEVQNWQTFPFTTIDPGKDIDILVLVPDHLLLGFPRDFNLNFEVSTCFSEGTACSWASRTAPGGGRSGRRRANGCGGLSLSTVRFPELSAILMLLSTCWMESTTRVSRAARCFGTLGLTNACLP
jgi:hypothetical protein